MATSSQAESPRNAWALTGGGEMGNLIRSIDWSRNPLGPSEGWPQSLRTVLSILLTSKHPIFVWWGKDLIQFYNDGYRPILGGTKHPLAMGQCGREGWAEIWDVIEPMIEAVMQRGESTFIEDGLLVLNRNGFLEECYFTYAFSPIRDESGGVGGVFVACTENTKRVLSDRRLRILSELGARDGVRRSMSQACENALGILATEPNDIPFALIYLFDQKSGEARLQCAVGVDGGEAMAPYALDPSAWPLGELAATGNPILFDITGFPGKMPAGPWKEPPRSALILPIARPGSTAPIGALIAGLSPRLEPKGDYLLFLELVSGQIAATLADVAAFDQERKRSEALAALDKAKTDFFSNVSHELRTPLTLMLGPLDDSLRDDSHPLAEVQRERIRLIQRNGVRLLSLVNNILEFSRIESGRARTAFARVDLAALTSDLASLFRSAMEKAGLEFTIDCPSLPEHAYVDAEMWEKIIFNLLSNAYKFTLAGKVSITLRLKDGRFETEVTDSGIGISGEDLPRIFERFHRVRDARAKMQEGSGIGLALARDLARIHGGEVRADSQPGKGSRFIVSIPAGKDHLSREKIVPSADVRLLHAERTQAGSFLAAALQAVPARSASPPPAQGDAQASGMDGEGAPAYSPRILIAEDNADMREYLIRLLKPYWQVEAVQDGRAALEAIRANQPDLLLSDVMMPHADGFSVLKEIRSHPVTAALPVILLSARAGEEATLEGIEAGADDYLVKPFSSRELLARVAARLEIAELRARERRARAEAEEQRNRLNTLFMDAPAPICILAGPEHVFEFVNPPFQQLFYGNALLGKALRAAVPRLDPAIHLILDGVYRGAPYLGKEYPIALDWGQGAIEERFFNFAFQPMRVGEGAVSGIVVYAFEVTEQVRARQVAQAAEKETHKFLALVEQSSDFVGLGNLQGRLTYINEAGRRMIGIADVDPAEGTPLLGLVIPEDVPLAGRILSLVQKQGRWEGEIHLRHSGAGKPIPVWCNTFQFRDRGDSESAGLAIVTRNLSQLRETEEHLRQAQKMEAIGKLAGGIAHDFNNLLTAINGYGDLALAMVGEGTLHDYLREIRNGGERAATLTRQLLAYSRKQMMQPKQVNLNEVIRDIQKILLRLIGEHIELKSALAPDLILVKVDPGQVGQILLNLAVNARDAMPHGGTLTLATGNVWVDPEYAAQHLDSPPGSYAVLEVADNGIGMSKEVLARAFEPFFTTKDVGKGTGLGLSSVYGIAKQSGGSVTVTSQEGGGTRFRIFLPALQPAAEAADVPTAVPAGAAVTAGKGEVIFLVEDESAVLAFVKRILEQKGYEVLAAKSGEEAMEAARAFPRPIALLLTDMVMPGMNGRRLAQLFGELNPDTRILFMSGYTEDHTLTGAGAGMGDDFIQKPFTPEGLFEKIRFKLGGSRGLSAEHGIARG